MRNLLFSILIVSLYCFPFVYFAMYQDFSHWSMLGYLIMIIGTSVLAFFCRCFSSTTTLIIGNIGSAIISLYFVHKMAGSFGGRWDGYFTPVSSYQLLLLVSALNLIPQFCIMKLASRGKNKQGKII
ncbi:hypothetical protein ACFVHQ_21735 [Actinomycetes bacterium NPDC127524]